MTDSLDSLTDAQLSEAFAVEVAGWSKNPSSASCVSYPWLTDSGAFAEDDSGIGLGRPVFATSADAVLPFLEKSEWINCNLNSESRLWDFEMYMNCDIENQFFSNAPTFARGACLVLIRAARYKSK